MIQIERQTASYAVLRDTCQDVYLAVSMIDGRVLGTARRAVNLGHWRVTFLLGTEREFDTYVPGPVTAVRTLAHLVHLTAI